MYGPVAAGILCDELGFRRKTIYIIFSHFCGSSYVAHIDSVALYIQQSQVPQQVQEAHRYITISQEQDPYLYQDCCALLTPLAPTNIWNALMRSILDSLTVTTVEMLESDVKVWS